MDQTVEHTEKNPADTKAAAAMWIAHGRQLHSAVYSMLHKQCPSCSLRRKDGPQPIEVASLTTNGLGCLPIVAEDGAYIIWT